MVWLSELRQEATLALRQLRRSPGFLVTAVATLALGIGASAAIFSAVHAVVLRPLPVPDPDRLVRFYSTSPTTTSMDESSPREFTAIRRESRSLEALAAVGARGVTVADGTGQPEQVRGIRTNPDYFRVFGIAALVGRVFTEEDDRPGHHGVAVISHRFWMARYGGERSVIGRTVSMDAEPFTIIGVAPEWVGEIARGVDVWVPSAFTAEEEANGRVRYLDVVARLRTNATLRGAEAEVATIAGRVAAEDGDVERSARLVPYTEDMVGSYRGRLFILLGAVGLVHLIGCVNVTNLLLARALGRRTELAVRVALGAGRFRIARQVLAETLVLGTAGGVLGLVLAAWAMGVLRATAAQGVPRLEQAALNPGVLAFTILVALGSSLVAGLLPAMRSMSVQPHGVLRQGRGAGARNDRMRSALVAAEVALSLVLLIGAGLLIRSAIATQNVDPGLRPDNVWTGRLTLHPARYPDAEVLARVFDQLIDSVAAMPGVRSAAAVSVPPFAGVRALGLFVPEGRPLTAESAVMANLRLISPGFFDALGIPLVRGRDFSDRDAAAAPGVVIVNQAFARSAWPGEDAVGKQLYGPGSDGPEAREIIAVARDIREDGLRETARPAVYYNLPQVPPLLWGGVQNSLYLVARTATERPDLTQTVGTMLAGVDENLAVSDALTIHERMAAMSATTRLNTQLLATLGLIGLLLAVGGTYAVIAYFVASSRREIGIRMALGASRRQVIGHVIGRGMQPVIIGLVAGGVAAVALTPLLASQLYGISRTDPVTFIGVAGLIAAAGLLAAVLPAHRAAAVDPKVALDA
ncbi:MAG TPA: ABC transporter permease [Longimicrobiales bacterium]